MSDRQCESPLLPESKRQLQLVLPRIILLTAGFGSLAYNLTWYLMSSQMTVFYTSDKDSNSDKGSRTLVQWSAPAMWLMWCCYLYGALMVAEWLKKVLYFASSVSDVASSSPISINSGSWTETCREFTCRWGRSTLNKWWMAQMEADGLGAWILWESLFRVICFALNTKP